MAINALTASASTTGGTFDLTAIESQLSANDAVDAAQQLDIVSAKSERYSPAGPANTSNWVYEDIDGERVEAFAIAGSENLTMLLSAINSQNHWHRVSHGEFVPWMVNTCKFLREGMFVYVKLPNGIRLYTVNAGATQAELAVMPVGADPAGYTSCIIS